ncbi:type III secretion system major needle protein, YscF/MxiH/PrgI family [Desulfomicrobium apsheronum]|jgi:type III secretion protein F|uniref:Type III secretion system major needle protein, YscF/MxiH/PrgI family n=3 Tax=Desulfomicrobium TaxID=898 RepID=A0A1I3PNE4_9BACT|nr:MULTISPECIES: EscF/YscF/HrpA family type III secretion system needle major subunit [Desulfomicrobium]NCC04270.1 type III secretion protein [Pseudomonadota bacterium]PKN39578.1 MAG: type III secretion protein [Deltaproteobacteria bacterium HGW-Deltaproteobacteria-20]PKN41147.1 MAG: type III secretion protein [Deltaproteobacteria bacterium HGW-Deltaproteobacteria-18]MBE1424192.1 type III secretion protein F [Desulfomicrobium macestii]MDY0226407.1 EscF/YscF/HrpA family type III secretion syste
MAISGTPGLNLGNLFDKSMEAVSKRGANIEQKMKELQNSESASPEQMAMLNFELGQYNAMLESLSTVTKSMNDMLKSLAQRAG